MSIAHLMLNPNLTPESLQTILDERNAALKRVLDDSIEIISKLPLEQRADATAKLLSTAAQFGLIGP